MRKGIQYIREGQREGKQSESNGRVSHAGGKERNERIAMERRLMSKDRGRNERERERERSKN